MNTFCLHSVKQCLTDSDDAMWLLNKKKALLYLSLDDTEFKSNEETLIAYNLYFSQRTQFYDKMLYDKTQK